MTTNIASANTDDVRALPSSRRCIEAPKYTCALGGALATITNIHRAVPIIHAGAGCGSSQMLSFRVAGGNQGSGYVGGMITPSSNLAEAEVVFGGERKLREQIRATVDLIDGDLFAVVPGCLSGIIGDDVRAVVKEFSAEPTPVLAVDTAGFGGNTYRGYEAVLEALTDVVAPADAPIRGLVNVIGLVPYQDVFWRGDLRQISSLLGSLGLTTNQVLGDFSGVDGVRRLGRAELTLVVSPWVGIGAAKRLEERFGIPFLSFPNLPVGPAESSELLREVGARLRLAPELIEAAVRDQAREAYAELDVAGDSCAQFASALPFAVIGSTATAVGLTRFLTNEAGFTPTLLIINDDPPEDVRGTIRARLSGLASGIAPEVVFEVDSYYMRQHLKSADYRVLLASSQERFLAQEEKKVFLSVAWPAHDRLVIRRSYAGFGGGAALLEDILSKFIMPY